MSKANDDINQVIVSAVNARVEAAVVEAMASDGALHALVASALSQPVPEPGYSSRTRPMITMLVEDTITKLAKDVVASEISAMEDMIRAEVRSALKKSVGVIADSLIDGFVADARSKHPSINVSFKGRD